MRALSESRFLTRLGSHLVEQIVVARARLLALPADNPVALAAAAMVTSETWLDHARMVMVGIGRSWGKAGLSRVHAPGRGDARGYNGQARGGAALEVCDGTTSDPAYGSSVVF